VPLQTDDSCFSFFYRQEERKKEGKEYQVISTFIASQLALSSKDEVYSDKFVIVTLTICTLSNG